MPGRRTSIIVIVIIMLLAAPALAQREENAGNQERSREPHRVLLVPFEPVDPQPQHQWAALSIERNLLAELARLPGVDPLSPAQPPEQTDLPALIEIARQMNAHFLVAGEYQVIESELRVTGRMVEVHTGRIVGGLTATGSVRDLFALQDRLTDQVRRFLPDLSVAGVDPQGLYLRQPPRIESTGPLRYAEPRFGYYEGSDLHRAVATGRIDRYYYHPSAYDPSFYGHAFPPVVVTIPIRRPLIFFPLVPKRAPVRFEPTPGRGHTPGFIPLTVQKPMLHTVRPMPHVPRPVE